MKKRLDRAEFYDYVVYPHTTWPIILILFITPWIILGCFYAMEQFYPKNATLIPWYVKFIAFGVTALSDSAFTAFIISWQKKIQIGISRAGLYIRSYGMIPWADIQYAGIVDCNGCNLDGTIQIKTTNHMKKIQPTSNFQKITEALDLIFETTIEKNTLYLYEGSIKQKNLEKIIQTYLDEYKQEQATAEKRFEKPLEKSYTTVQKKKKKEKKALILKLGTSFFLALGAFIASLIYGEALTDSLFMAASGLFAGLMVLFWIPRLIVLFIASLAMIFAIPTLWLWGEKIQSDFFLIPVSGVIFLITVLFDLHRRKKIYIKNIRLSLIAAACVLSFVSFSSNRNIFTVIPLGLLLFLLIKEIKRSLKQKNVNNV